jgi:hypothetical protein
MTSEVLSELYSSPVEVVRRGDSMLVVGAADVAAHQHEDTRPRHQQPHHRQGLR